MHMICSICKCKLQDNFLSHFMLTITFWYRFRFKGTTKRGEMKIGHWNAR